MGEIPSVPVRNRVVETAGVERLICRDGRPFWERGDFLRRPVRPHA
jgi:hypothetical protein